MKPIPIINSRTVGECQDRINRCMQLLDDLARLYQFSWERLINAIDDGVVPPEELNALILNDHTRFYHLSLKQLTAAIDDGIVLPEELDALKQHGSSCVYFFSGQLKKTLQGMISLLEDFNLKNDFPLGDNWNWIKTQWTQLKDEYAWYTCIQNLMVPEEILAKWVSQHFYNGILNEYVNPNLEDIASDLKRESIRAYDLFCEIVNELLKFQEAVNEMISMLNSGEG